MEKKEIQIGNLPWVKKEILNISLIMLFCFFGFLYLGFISIIHHDGVAGCIFWVLGALSWGWIIYIRMVSQVYFYEIIGDDLTIHTLFRKKQFKKPKFSLSIYIFTGYIELKINEKDKNFKYYIPPKLLKMDTIMLKSFQSLENK